MKKIIALISAVLILFSLAACNRVKPGEVEPSPVEKAQGEIISSLGNTNIDRRIVAYQATNDYIRYISVVYEDGKKVSEDTHYFFITEHSFREYSEKLSNAAGLVIDAEKQYLTYKSAEANTGSYETDLSLIRKEYTVK